MDKQGAPNVLDKNENRGIKKMPIWQGHFLMCPKFHLNFVDPLAYQSYFRIKLYVVQRMEQSISLYHCLVAIGKERNV